MPESALPSDDRTNVVPIRDAGAKFPHIPGYRFQKRLGQGGMATVYLATQESLDRPVSIKVMEADALVDETSKQRFENEARTIAKLSHPNIVAIYEVGRTDDGRMYYIMPYLASGDLAQRDMRTDEPRIVEVLRALLSALGYAHARGIVHRDVKLGNVLFDADDRPLLADFGIAISKSDDARITTAGIAVGSSGYMSPEQARGDVVDGRADLYSVGVLAYELLTGDLPFQAPDALALALMHFQNPVPKLPPGKRHWQSFIDRAMAKSPDQRYSNAQQMIEALDQTARRTGTQISNRVLRTIDRTVDSRSGRRPWVIAGGVALLLAGGLFAARDRLMPSIAGKPAAAVAVTDARPASSSPAQLARAASSPAGQDSTSASPASPDAASAAASGASSAVDSSASASASTSTTDGSNASDASGASSTSDASDQASSTTSSHKTHARRQAPPPPRRKPRENIFKRIWHRL